MLACKNIKPYSVQTQSPVSAVGGYRSISYSASAPICLSRSRGAVLVKAHESYRRNNLNKDREQEVITLFTPDGLVELPGRTRHSRLHAPSRHARTLQPLPSVHEQKLCIGSSFLVLANNGLDLRRTVVHSGWCHSIDLLLASIQDIIQAQGGEIMEESRELKSGLHEYLKLRVAMPYLFGVPASLDYLRSAIKVGGGFIECVHHRWDMRM